MSDETKVIISFVIVLVLAPFYVIWLVKRKPGNKRNKVTKIIEFGKANGHHTAGQLTSRSYDSFDSNDEILAQRTNCTYVYLIDGHKYHYKCTLDGYVANVNKNIDLFYKPNHPNQAYPESGANYVRSSGCLVTFFGLLPFIAPFILSAILIHFF